MRSGSPCPAGWIRHPLRWSSAGAMRQHLHDAEAYRRDRRKDLLLQENGYLVLRFLAEDVGTHLDAILDTILRALVGRTRSRPSPEIDPTPY